MTDLRFYRRIFRVSSSHTWRISRPLPLLVTVFTAASLLLFADRAHAQEVSDFGVLP